MSTHVRVAAACATAPSLSFLSSLNQTDVTVLCRIGHAHQSINTGK